MGPNIAVMAKLPRCWVLALATCLAVQVVSLPVHQEEAALSDSDADAEGVIGSVLQSVSKQESGDAQRLRDAKSAAGNRASSIQADARANTISANEQAQSAEVQVSRSSRMAEINTKLHLAKELARDD